MKKIKFFAVAALFAVATSASAQFTNTSSKSSSSSVNTDGWNTVWVEWNPSTFNYDIKNVDNQSFTGLSLGFSKAISLTSSIPLYAEAGLGVQYSFYTNDDSKYYETKVNLLSAKVPVSLMYAFQIPNTSVTLLPFAGIDLRYNILGKQKTTYSSGGSGWYEDDDDDEYYYDYRRASGYEDDEWYEGYDDDDDERSLNLFDKKDMNGNEWKRFQIGWHIGVKARFNDKFLVGVSYGSDFSEIAKKAKISTVSVTLGYTF